MTVGQTVQGGTSVMLARHFILFALALCAAAGCVQTHQVAGSSATVVNAAGPQASVFQDAAVSERRWTGFGGSR
jgi:hypothetical protein